MGINPKDARYRDTLNYVRPDGGRPVFRGMRPRRIKNATGVLEHIVHEDERLDILALHYYNDTRRWWRIVDANPDIIFGGDLLLNEMVGLIILIPRVVEPESVS